MKAIHKDYGSSEVIELVDISVPSAKTLQNGIDLMAAGKFKPVVSKTFKLKEVANAQDFLSAGGVNGKVVLMMD